ncbi:MAG: hypothetical protein P8P80_01745 [Crocinitomicaceae bacterium]|nr:hypothetical protein [Crocinitomicaceae bacterium]MDG1734710.1 hypothetical protein [Crocinitomicaceae bacterium]MDG2506328.1 hypothetical protein [Crocinitomicaceae bacterium]
MNRITNKINHEAMKLLITDKVAYKTATLHAKGQIMRETRYKVESLLLFATIFTAFFSLMMLVKALIIL